MTTEMMLAAIEAQFIMRHEVGAYHTSRDRTTIENYSWDVDQVRQALHVPLNDLWEGRVLALELAGLTSFSLYAAPVYHDEDGTEHVIEGWEDEPRENWGSLSIYAAGVLRLAAEYGRPYVRWSESKALVGHWELIHEEIEARLKAPYDHEKWEREFPERALALRAQQAQWEIENPLEEM